MENIHVIMSVINGDLNGSMQHTTYIERRSVAQCREDHTLVIRENYEMKSGIAISVASL